MQLSPRRTRVTGLPLRRKNRRHSSQDRSRDPCMHRAPQGQHWAADLCMWLRRAEDLLHHRQRFQLCRPQGGAHWERLRSESSGEEGSHHGLEGRMGAEGDEAQLLVPALE